MTYGEEQCITALYGNEAINKDLHTATTYTPEVICSFEYCKSFRSVGSMLQWQEQNEKRDEPSGYMNVYTSVSSRKVPSSAGKMEAARSSDWYCTK